MYMHMLPAAHQRHGQKLFPSKLCKRKKLATILADGLRKKTGLHRLGYTVTYEDTPGYVDEVHLSIKIFIYAAFSKRYMLIDTHPSFLLCANKRCNAMLCERAHLSAAALSF